MQKIDTQRDLHRAAHIFVIEGALERLRLWAEERQYAGYEPYDLLNSPFLSRVWKRSSLVSNALIQFGKRFGGLRTRKWLRVPESKNPKAFGLFLAGYCDLAHCWGKLVDRVAYFREELKRLRSPEEADFCWGYDWNFVSLRGTILRAFAPNSIATVFCANALLDAAEAIGDVECEQMALSASRFCVTRLKRSPSHGDELCFSYTSENQTLIYNNSLLVGALLARVAVPTGNSEYLELARQSMQFVCNRQKHNGAWTYGSGKMQGWVDGFHTGYNLCAISSYRRYTGDHSFDEPLCRGYEFYKRKCFSSEGIPKYFERQLYPVDIHACSQAVLTFCEFAGEDSQALDHAVQIALWTIRNMCSREGYFYYQKHRVWTNRTPYMRWAQAWMFRALARVLAKLKEQSK